MWMRADVVTHRWASSPAAVSCSIWHTGPAGPAGRWPERCRWPRPGPCPAGWPPPGAAAPGSHARCLPGGTEGGWRWNTAEQRNVVWFFDWPHYSGPTQLTSRWWVTLILDQSKQPKLRQSSYEKDMTTRGAVTSYYLTLLSQSESGDVTQIIPFRLEPVISLLKCNEISRGVQRENACGGFSLICLCLVPHRRWFTDISSPLPRPRAPAHASHTALKSRGRHAGQAFEIGRVWVCGRRREKNRLNRQEVFLCFCVSLCLWWWAACTCTDFMIKLLLNSSPPAPGGKRDVTVCPAFRTLHTLSYKHFWTQECCSLYKFSQIQNIKV